MTDQRQTTTVKLEPSDETREMAEALIMERLARVSECIGDVRREAAIVDVYGNHPYKDSAVAREHVLQERANFLLERWTRVHNGD